MCTYVCIRKEQNTDCNCNWIGTLHYAMTMFAFIRCIQVCFSLFLFLNVCVCVEHFACTVKNMSGSDVTLAAVKRKKAKKKDGDDKNIAFHHFINSNDIDRHCWFKHRIVLSLAIFSLVTLFSSSLTLRKSTGCFFLLLLLLLLLLCNGRQCHLCEAEKCSDTMKLYANAAGGMAIFRKFITILASIPL